MLASPIYGEQSKESHLQELKMPQAVLPVSASQRAVCSHFSASNTVPDKSFSVCLANGGLSYTPAGTPELALPAISPCQCVFI